MIMINQMIQNELAKARPTNVSNILLVLNSIILVWVTCAVYNKKPEKLKTFVPIVIKGGISIWRILDKWFLSPLTWFYDWNEPHVHTYM